MLNRKQRFTDKYNTEANGGMVLRSHLHVGNQISLYICFAADADHCDCLIIAKQQHICQNPSMLIRVYKIISPMALNEL